MNSDELYLTAVWDLVLPSKVCPVTTEYYAMLFVKLEIVELITSTERQPIFPLGYH